ncbi:MAG: serine--tRNA ligase [Syntrophobacterales bacterium CG_4_8_14_3_um_filter_58_8]|nr:MAG: serine--tRNA ligase [Syntrophaceae bacterium CG2_30_58_14]PIU99990.1 MAG: serine--tRNA ligase [Syntrophobacterales bacterium CG03_land_8_20_14_0_80_58_14]PJC73977.1 MAG: serine--tRNA ligase [Syntrophobacterales bacterium CG_4_8_14_3_um_filter_58_8]
MLDIKYLRQNIDFVSGKMRERGQEMNLERFIVLDAARREMIREVEGLRGERNAVSKQIGEKKKNREDANDIIARMGLVSARIKELDEALKKTDEDLDAILMTIPNLPHASVVCGRGAEDNPVVRVWGEKPQFSFKPRPHWEIGESLNILDFARGAKITGARFTLYRGFGARMERALINFMLDLHTGEHGYTEVLPPFLVNRESMTGTGQLPKFEEDLFRIDKVDYFLIPTAEVPVTNIHRDEILSEKELPIYYVAYTPCFRAEAGSYGKDTRGLIRQHQFNKVELVKFTKPESSYEEMEKLTLNAEEVLKRLKIPYRVVSLCTADLGFSSAKTYDVEAWLPGQDAYREISSCSNFEEFQARRASIRFRRDESGKVEFVHTLNGSGLAVGRTLVAVLENYQQEDGSVVIPEALRPYMGGVDRIPAAG